jgi:dipeptidyl aminopeptidase/acylaminoacyl peptidase
MAKTKKLRKITTEDLKNFISVGDAQISPDGKKILFTKSNTNEKNKVAKNLWVADAKTGEAAQYTSSDKDGHGRWSPDGKSIAFISGRKEGQAQIHLIPTSGGEAKALSKLPEGTLPGFKWSPDGKTIAFIFRETAEEYTKKGKKEREEKGLNADPAKVIDKLWYRMDGDGYFIGQRFHLYTLDVETGEHKVLYNKAPDGVFNYDWSPDSKEVLIIANQTKEPMLQPWKGRFYTVNVKTKKVNLLPGQVDGSFSNAVWSPDGKKIAFSARLGKVPGWASQNENLYVYTIKSKSFKCISNQDDYCMGATVIGDTAEAKFGSNFIWTPDSKHILANFGWHGDKHIYKIKATGGKFEALTSGKAQFGMSNQSSDGKLLPVVQGDIMNPGDVCLGKITEKGISLKRLTAFNKELLAELELSTPKDVWVKTPDGNKVHVWVMKPIGYKADKKYPGVLEIHGGPHALYGNTFFHEFQVLAANGYAVFFSNPRGSKGYGEDHCHTIAGDWGNKDWIDVQAVTDYMKKQKFVDTKKMGVMGGSYGGYMTNWTIGHCNEFAGAITDRCVSNMLSMMGSSDFVTLPNTYWKGDTWNNIEKFWQQSPISYFKNVKTPTLIIHSEGDLRCNVEQAEQVFMVLKVKKVPTRFVRYPKNTSHGMSRGGPADLRIHRLEQILEWWKIYLK